MELFQEEIEGEQKSRRSYFSHQTGTGSLGCWGSPAGLTMSGVCFAPAIDLQFLHVYHDNIANVRMPPFLAESIQVTVHRFEARPSRPLRERELAWRRTHAETLRQFENEWVVLDGEEIIAHSSAAAEAIRQAKSRGIRTPYIFFVEPESDNSVRIGL